MKKILIVLLLLGLTVFSFSRAWWQDAVFYEVFVRSFYDSDGNGIGDLKGLTEKLDYLNDGVSGKGDDLGVNAIWLMPIFASPSYHGYDTTDYKAINPDYGTMEDFDLFLKEAHRRGIRVILDLVINHTSSRNPWFMKSASSKKKYENYYVWSKKLPSGEWQRPWGGGNTSAVWHYNATRHAYYYAAFSGGMPDLNLTEPKVIQEVKDIAKFWLDKGVDGFRLDAARYMIEEGPGKGQADTPSTLLFWKNFETFIRSVKSDSMTVGEVWTGTSTVSRYYQNGQGLDLCFDFELADAILRGARYGAMKDVAKKIEEKTKFPAPRRFYAPFLSNHDQTRAMTVLGKDIRSAKIAAAILLVQPGTPFLYYGEEIGMPNSVYSDDRAKRTPMMWDHTVNNGFTSGKSIWNLPSGYDEKGTVKYQISRKDSLLSFYRKLIQIRKNNPELQSDDIRVRELGNTKVILIERVSDGNVSYLLANGSKQSQKVTLPKDFVQLQFIDLLKDQRLKFPSQELVLPAKALFLIKEI